MSRDTLEGQGVSAFWRGVGTLPRKAAAGAVSGGRLYEEA